MHEFLAATQVCSLPNNGLKFNFTPQSALFATHAVKLRRKQRTPVLGQKLPRFPGNKPTEEGPGRMTMAAWKKEMNVFAAVVVPMFAPWSMGVRCAYTCNTEGLQNLLSALDSSTSTVIQKGRGKLFSQQFIILLPETQIFYRCSGKPWS